MQSAQSERHARVEALLRRRRQGVGYESPRGGNEEQTSSLPPPRMRTTSGGSSGSRPPVPRRGSGNRDGSSGYNESVSDRPGPEGGELSTAISMPAPPPAPPRRETSSISPVTLP